MPIFNPVQAAAPPVLHVLAYDPDNADANNRLLANDTGWNNGDIVQQGPSPATVTILTLVCVDSDTAYADINLHDDFGGVLYNVSGGPAAADWATAIAGYLSGYPYAAVAIEEDGVTVTLTWYASSVTNNNSTIQDDLGSFSSTITQAAVPATDGANFLLVDKANRATALGWLP